MSCCWWFHFIELCCHVWYPSDRDERATSIGTKISTLNKWSFAKIRIPTIHLVSGFRHACCWHLRTHEQMRYFNSYFNTEVEIKGKTRMRRFKFIGNNLRARSDGDRKNRDYWVFLILEPIVHRSSLCLHLCPHFQSFLRSMRMTYLTLRKTANMLSYHWMLYGAWESIRYCFQVLVVKHCLCLRTQEPFKMWFQELYLGTRKNITNELLQKIAAVTCVGNWQPTNRIRNICFTEIIATVFGRKPSGMLSYQFNHGIGIFGGTLSH